MSVLDNINNPAPKLKNIDRLSGLLTDGGFNLLNFIFFLVGMIFFVNIILSGWEYMFSAGDPQKAESANARLINGFIGLIVVVASFIIVRLVSGMIGLDNII